MTTISASHGTDTHARSTSPNRNYSGGDTLRLQSTTRRGFVHVPVTDIRGRTVLSATLTGHAKGTFVAQTVTVAAVVDSWSASRVTWNSQPAVGASVATVLGSHVDGDSVNLDVTSLLQAVANGGESRGFRLTTSTSSATGSLWSSFDDAGRSWMLTVELSDAPEQPSDLRPNQGAVGAAAPIVAWSYTDLGGDSSEQGAFKVQADAAADGVSPDFDSGWITSADPQYNLASGSFTPLASHASTQWRVMTRDATGNDSEWSDWAEFSYEPYPTLTMDSPTGGVIGDSTPNVVAHLTGETLTQWRVRVENAAGVILWDSGLNDGALAITVPKRNDDNLRVIKRDDATYTFRTRAWGDVQRTDAVGLSAYVEQVVHVVFDDDAGVIAPDTLTVAAAALGDPRTTFTWHRTAAPDAVLLLRGGEVVERLDSDDWSVVSGTYTWTDDGLATPFTAETWTVRAVESGVRSHASNAVTYTSKISQVWLVPDDGSTPIAFETRQAIDSFTVADRRAIYKTLNGGTNSIVYGFEGASGNFSGLLGSSQDQAAAITRLAALREDVSAQPRLVWGVSIPVQVSNLKVLPAADHSGAQTIYNVSFDFIQIGD